MNQREILAIHQKVQSVLDGGNMLLIVPPFVTSKTPILQAIVQKQDDTSDVLLLSCTKDKS